MKRQIHGFASQHSLLLSAKISSMLCDILPDHCNIPFFILEQLLKTPLYIPENSLAHCYYLSRIYLFLTKIINMWNPTSSVLLVFFSFSLFLCYQDLQAFIFQVVTFLQSNTFSLLTIYLFLMCCASLL